MVTMRRLRAVILAVMLAAVSVLSSCGPPDAQLTLIYTTDAHGRVVTDEETIGLDVIAAIKAAEPHSLLLDSGDFLHGLPIATLTQGRDIISLMKSAGYFAAAIGNHDFNYGREQLKLLFEQARTGENSMRLLSANVYGGDGEPEFEPWAITEISGLKVGVFGLTTEETVMQASPSAIAGLMFRDVLQGARDAVAALEGEGCDLIIALTHVGSDDMVAVKSTDIATNVPGIDIILDGHSHVLLEPVKAGGAIIVSAGEHNKNVGRLHIKYSRRQGAVTQYDNAMIGRADIADIEPDAQVAGEAARISGEQAALLGEVVGASQSLLMGEKEAVRTRETSLGSLVADAMMDLTGADAAIMNGGCIRATIGPGEVTRGDLIEAFPFANIVVTKWVTGAQLWDIIEHGLYMLPQADGRFPQIGGMSIEADPAAAPGNRLISVTMAGGGAINPESRYVLATNDFIAAGGDGYPHLAGIPVLTQPMTVEEAVERYLARQGGAGYDDGVAGRIRLWCSMKNLGFFIEQEKGGLLRRHMSAF